MRMDGDEWGIGTLVHNSQKMPPPHRALHSGPSHQRLLSSCVQTVLFSCSEMVSSSSISPDSPAPQSVPQSGDGGKGSRPRDSHASPLSDGDESEEQTGVGSAPCHSPVISSELISSAIPESAPPS